MLEKLSKRLVPYGRAHPRLRWPILGLLMLAWCLDGAWAFARALGREIWAVVKEVGQHLRETGLTPQGIHDNAERLLDDGIRAAKKLPGLWNQGRQVILPLVYTKGRAVFHTARQWSLAQISTAKVAVPVYYAQVKTLVKRAGCGVAGFARRSADKLRADLPQYKRHAPRRAMAAALALVLCLGMLPVSAFAAEMGCTHVHDASCYHRELTCGQDEAEAHAHEDACYTDQPICGAEASAGHSHGDTCYTDVPTCTQAEHSHVYDCYDMVGELICRQAEHTHGPDCHTRERTCGQEASEGHAHTDACYTADPVCGKAEVEGHSHTDVCYTETLDCKHVHDAACGGLPQEPEIPAVPECTCGATPDAEGNTIHAEDCPLYTAPETPPVLMEITSLEGGPEAVQTAMEGAWDVHSLPATLTGVYEGGTVEIPVSWDGLPTPAAKGNYTLTANLTLPEGYALAGGVNAPTVALTLTPDPAVDAVRTLIAALPTPEAVSTMTEEEREENGAYEKMEAAYNAYDALTEAQKALLPGAMDTFTALQAALSAAPMLMAMGDLWDGKASITWYNEEQSEFTLTTAVQLAGLAKLVNAGNSFSGKVILLDSDLDLNIIHWTPIGTLENPFCGEFDGQGHTISRLNVNQLFSLKENEYQVSGLFGAVEGRAGRPCIISNLTVGGGVRGATRGAVNSGSIAGGIVGQAGEYTTIQSCASGVVVSGSVCAGGVVGKLGRRPADETTVAMKSTIQNCYAIPADPDYPSPITGDAGSYASPDAPCNVGGIVGEVTAVHEVKSCYATVEVVGNAYSNAGGIVGLRTGKATLNSCVALNPSVTLNGNQTEGPKLPTIGHVEGNAPSTGSCNDAFAHMYLKLVWNGAELSSISYPSTNDFGTKGTLISDEDYLTRPFQTFSDRAWTTDENSKMRVGDALENDALPKLIPPNNKAQATAPEFTINYVYETVYVTADIKNATFAIRMDNETQHKTPPFLGGIQVTVPLTGATFGTTVSAYIEAECPNLLQSPTATISIPKRPAAPTTPVGGAGKITGLAPGMWLISSDGRDMHLVEPGQTEYVCESSGYYYVTYVGADSTDSTPGYFESEKKSVYVTPALPPSEKPSGITINYKNEWLIFPAAGKDYKFRINGEDVKVNSDERYPPTYYLPLNEAYFGTTIQITQQTDSSHSHSDPLELKIPARTITQTPTGLTGGRNVINGTTTAMEWSTNGTEWKPATEGSTSTGSFFGSFYVRIKATAENTFAGPRITVQVTAPLVKEPQTVYKDNYEELLKGFVVGKTYGITVGSVTTEYTATETTLPIRQYLGKELIIVCRGDNITTCDSDPKYITVSEYPAPTSPSGAGGKIIGVQSTYEYRKQGDTAWIAITGATVTNVEPGVYEVRRKADSSSLVSPVKTVTVGFAVTGVTMPETLTLEVGRTIQLAATVQPENAFSKAVSWAFTSDTMGAFTFEAASGRLTGKTEGATGTITVTTADGGFTATCAVTVVAASSPTGDLTAVYANGAPIRIVAGETEGYTNILYDVDGQNGIEDTEYLKIGDADPSAAGYDLSKCSIYGGKSAQPLNGDSNITMEGGKVASIYGGGFRQPMQGSSNITMKGGSVGALCGGNYVAAMTGNTNIIIESGNITASVYGGGSGSYSPLTGDTNITMRGGSVAGSIYGGGMGDNNLGMTGDTHVTVTGGSVTGSIYGGCYDAKLTGNTHVEVSGSAKVDVSIYGGNNAYDQYFKHLLTGSTNVIVDGVTVQYICGGNANGDKGPVTGDTNVQLRNGAVAKSITCDVAATDGEFIVTLRDSTVTGYIQVYNAAKGRVIVSGSSAVGDSGNAVYYPNLHYEIDGELTGEGKLYVGLGKNYLPGVLVTGVKDQATADKFVLTSSSKTSGGSMVYDAENQQLLGKVTVASVSLSSTTLPMTVGGGTSKLTATLLPTGVHPGVTWTSSDESVATVAADGTVTAISVGTATITATSVVDPTKSRACTVNVDDIVTVDTANKLIFGNGNALLLVAGDTADLTTVYIDADKSGALSEGDRPLIKATNQDLSGYTVYGGTRDAEYTGNPKITMTGGKVATLYGGGKKPVKGNTAVTVTDGTVTDLYGGGSAYVDHDTAITVTGGKVSYIHGGGTAYVYGNTTVTATGGIISSIDDGESEVAGTTTVNVTGCTVKSSIDSDTITATNSTLGKVTGVTVTLTGCTVNSSVSSKGKGSTIVNSVIIIDGGTVSGSVWGAASTDGSIKQGNTSITLRNGAVVSGSVYGSTAGVAVASSTITITDSTVAKNIYSGAPSAKNEYTNDPRSGTVSGAKTITLGGNAKVGSVVSDSEYYGVCVSPTWPEYIPSFTIAEGGLGSDALVYVNLAYDIDLSRKLAVATNVREEDASKFLPANQGNINGTKKPTELVWNGTDSVVAQEKITAVTSISISAGFDSGHHPTMIIPRSGRERLLSAKVFPADASDKGVTWTSSDPNVAVLSTDGTNTIKVFKPGTTTFTATTTSTKFPPVSATCVVTVVATPPTPTVVLTGLNYKSIFANGAPLLITGATSDFGNTGTTIYIDLNGNGQVDYGEQSLKDTQIANAPNDISDLSNYDVYGGSSTAAVTGDTRITMNGGKINNLYGGGFRTNVAGSTHVTINEGYLSYVYGGGYTGDVEGDANIEVNGGRVYGVVGSGKNLAAVRGDTNITVNDGLIEGTVYGGGEFAESTVSGMANVALLGGNVFAVQMPFLKDAQKSVSIGGDVIIGRKKISDCGILINGPGTSYARTYGVDSFTITAPLTCADGAITVNLTGKYRTGVIATGATPGDEKKFVLYWDSQPLTDKEVRYEDGKLVVWMEPVAATGIKLNKTALELTTAETAQLNATITPPEATDLTVLWTSSDEKVATVSDKGLVSVVGVGTATITATTKSGGFTATCVVTTTLATMNNIRITDKDSLFSGAEKEVFDINGYPDGGTIWSRRSEDAPWVEGAPKATYPGEETVYIKITHPQYADYTASATYHISKAGLQIYNGNHATVSSTKVYDGTTTATVTKQGTLYPAPGSEKLTLGCTAIYDNANVGSGKTVTLYYSVTGENAQYFIPPVSKTVTASITAKPYGDGMEFIFEGVSDLPYNGQAQKLPLVIKWGEITLAEGTDYTVSYTGGTNVGIAKATITFGGNYSGSTSKTFQITRKTLTASDLTITGLAEKYPFTGEQITPLLTIKRNDTNATLALGMDYTVIYGENEVVGEDSGTVTIRFMGNYAGDTLVLHFTIDYATLPDVSNDEIFDKTADELLVWGKDDITVSTKDGWFVSKTAPVGGSTSVTLDTPSTGPEGTTETLYVSDGTNTYTTTVTYHLDKTPPEMPTVTVPGDGLVGGWHNTVPVEITVVATDAASGVAKWEYSTDGGATWVTGENGKFDITKDGTHQVLVKVTDKVGNVTTTTPAVEVKIDAAAPDAVLSGVPGVGAWTKDDVTITVTGSDATAGLADAPYSFDGGVTWQAENSKTYTENTSGIVIQVKDAAGNVKTLDTVSLTAIDKTAPAVPVVKIGGITLTPGSSEAMGETITVTLTPTPGSPETYAYTLNGATVTGNLTEKVELTLTPVNGSNTLSITVTDEAGSKTEQTYTMAVTTELPSAPTIDLGEVPGLDGKWTDGDITITLPTEGGKDYAYRVLPDGEWKSITDGMLVFEKDEDSGKYEVAEKVTVGGNDYYGKPTEIEVKIDTTDPEANFGTVPELPASGWYTGEVTIPVNISDANLKDWYYSLDGGTTWTKGEGSSFTISIDGNYPNVVIKAVDQAGNEKTTTPISVKVDATVPTASFSGVPGVGAWVKDDVTITVTATDATAGLADAPYSFDGGVSWQADSSKTYTENATGIVIQVKDAAGNVKTLDTMNLTAIDKIAPAAPVVQIGGYEVTESTTEAFGKTIDVTLTPIPGSPETYAYTLNGVTATDSLTEKAELSLSAASGANTLIITITDAAGNTTEKTYTVSITTEVPDAPGVDVGNIPGLDGGFTKGDVTVTLPDGKDYVYREKPDGVWKDVEDGKLVFDQDSDSGDYELAEKVTVDGKDYYGEPTDITVKIDKTVPEIDSAAITATPGLNQPTNQPVVITVPVTDDGSGIESVTVTPSKNATVTGPVDGKYTVTVTENGEYTVTVADKAGNTATTTQTVTGMDKTKPTVTVTPETDSGKWYGKTDLTVTATDPDGSGIASTVITVDGKAVSSPVSITDKGEHTVVVTVTDAAGNVTTVTKTVNVDPAIDTFKGAVDALGENPTIEAVQDVLDNYLSLGDDEKTHIQNSDIGKDAWNNLQDELKEQQDAITDKIDGILDKENPTISDINDAENLFDILDKEAQDKIDKGKLEQLIKDRDAAQTVVDQLQDADSYEEQKAAVDAYDRLTEEQKKLADGVLTPGTVADMKTDVSKVGEVIGLIDGIKKPYTPATKDAVQTAKDAYDKLDADQKSLLPSYEKETLDSLLTQSNHVKAVEDKISALTKPHDASENAAIKAAQGAYDKLTADEKSMVDKYLKAKLDELYKAMLDAIATGSAAADKVIQDIIKVENDPSHTVEDIQRVEDAYNKLPQDAKDKVDSTVVDAPKTAGDILDQLVDDKDAVKDLVDNLNKLDPDKLTPGNVADIGKAETDYGKLTDDQKELVDNSTVGKLPGLVEAVEDAEEVEQAIEKIPGHTGGTTNPDGTPDLGHCDDSSNAGPDNTGTGGHTIADHRTAIEDAKYAYEMLSEAGRKLIDPAAVTQLNNQYKALMSYLEYVNRKEVSGAAVEVIGLAEKVDAPTPPVGGKTVIAVELKVEEPPAAIKPEAPAGKTQALSVDVKLIATKLNSAGAELASQQVQPASGKTVLVKLLLPTGYDLDTLEIVHVKDSGAQYPIRNFHITTEDGGSYAVFEVSSFSHFVFFANKMPTGDTGSGTVTPPAPKPDIPSTDHGSTTVSPQQPKPGANVTVNPKPDEGYVVDQVIVTDQSGKDIPVKDNGDGTYSYTQPNGKVTVTVTFKPAPKDMAFPFTDVSESDWFYESVKYVYEKGLMVGTSDSTFSPYLTTSRGMIVTILWRLENEPDAAGTNSFADVSSDAYYAKAVAWAAENGIVKGYGNGNFGPSDLITREQLTAILYRYTQFKGQDVTAAGDLSKFTDQPSAWAIDAMQWAVGAGVINGKGNGTLDPKGQATRAEAAAMLTRYLSE